MEGRWGWAHVFHAVVGVLAVGALVLLVAARRVGRAAATLSGGDKRRLAGFRAFVDSVEKASALIRRVPSFLPVRLPLMYRVSACMRRLLRGDGGDSAPSSTRWKRRAPPSTVIYVCLYNVLYMSVCEFDG